MIYVFLPHRTPKTYPTMVYMLNSIKTSHMSCYRYGTDHRFQIAQNIPAGTWCCRKAIFHLCWCGCCRLEVMRLPGGLRSTSCANFPTLISTCQTLSAYHISLISCPPLVSYYYRYHDTLYICNIEWHIKWTKNIHTQSKSLWPRDRVHVKRLGYLEGNQNYASLREIWTVNGSSGENFP